MPGHRLPIWRLPALVLLCLAMLLPALQAQPATASPHAGELSQLLAVQSDTTMPPPVVAITCSVYADNFFSMEGIGFDLPEGCAFDASASFTITDTNGNFYGSCVAGGSSSCRSDVRVPVDVEVLVRQDEASIPAGYVVVGGNPQAHTYPSSAIQGEGALWLFVTLPADVAGGQVAAPTEIATEATPVTETVPAAAPATGGSTSVRIEPGQDWIAYVGEDGNIWLMQPDGSQQTQVTTDGTFENSQPSYSMPAWSHDGTMLTFAARFTYGDDYDARNGIWMLRDGHLTQVPNAGGSCQAPAFSADDQRLLYNCPQRIDVGDPVPADLTTNPLQAYVTSSLLDGSDQRIEVPYTIDDSGVKWTSESKSGLSIRRVDVRPTDGTILVSYTGFHAAGVQLFAADGTLMNSFTLFEFPGERLGPSEARFTPDGNGLIGILCMTGCYGAADIRQYDILLFDLQGNILDRWLQAAPDQALVGVDIAPDGTRVVTSIVGGSSTGNATDAALTVIDGSMQPVAIGLGRNPAWQPNRTVKAQRPAATDVASTAESPVSPEAPGVASNPITGVWSGTGYQSPQAIDWPISIHIHDGAVGEVLGRAEYPSYGCVGELTLTAINADGSITLRERIVEGVGICVDGGEFALRPGGEGSIVFRWEAPDGTSSAEGTLAPVSGGAVPPLVADAPGGDAEAGPPSLYDDLEAEPVPIEPEGGV